MADGIDLNRQVALVTGGGRGLGRRFAEALAAAGAAVAVVARTAAQLAETVASIDAAGGSARAFVADVTDQQAVERAVAATERQLGPIDLLVNAAGIATPLGAIWEVEPAAWWRCLEVNLRGPFLCSRAVVPSMVARGRGRVVNVVSTAGLRAAAYWSAYSTSKAALLRLSEILAAESEPHGLRVFAINPGMVRTQMTEWLAESPEGQKWLPHVRDTLAAGRDVDPQAAVALLLFIASGRGDPLSGRFLNVADDVEQLLARQRDIVEQDLYTLRLRLPVP